EPERGEDPGGDRDERERHGERLEVPQRAHELLPVAEPGEYGVVVVLGEGGHPAHHFLGGPLPGHFSGRYGAAVSRGRRPTAVACGCSVTRARSSVRPAAASAAKAAEFSASS